MTEELRVRPYQMLCLVCSLGEEIPGEQGERVRDLRDAIREYPDRPVSLRARALDVYCYQDPGITEDTSEGEEFNRKRDLDILYRLDLAPGSTLPARTLLYRVLKAIPSVAGLCGYEEVTGEAWRGCARAKTGYYEKGAKAGIEALIAPRDKEECAREKRASVAEMYRQEHLRLRPHVIMCAVCHYGSTGGQGAPLANDNIVEFIEIIRRHPEVPVTLMQGADWMICASCPRRVPQLNACVNVAGSGGLSNEKRDLDLLQRIGLTYGSTLPAREMLGLIFERVHTTMKICRRDSPSLSVWWDECGENNRTRGEERYEKGRQMLIEELGLRRP